MTILQRVVAPRLVAWPFAWGGSIALAALAFVLRIRIFTALPPLPMLFFLPAITLSAMIFGRRGGLIATSASTVLTTYFFLLPNHSSALFNRNALLSLALFIATGLFMTFIVGALRNAYLQAEEMRQRSQAAHLEAETARAIAAAGERERMLAEAARAAAEAGERERELLLVEFGHRVKNDLQRISGTFHLQAARATPQVAATLKWAANQVNVTAALHDRLAHRGGQVQVDVGSYIDDLAAILRASIAGEQDIRLSVEAESHVLPFDRASMIGLIVNELVTNALKHAFPGSQPGTIRPGTIHVAFGRDGSNFLLTVGDNGIGMKPTQSDPIWPSSQGVMNGTTIDASADQAEPRRMSLGHRLIRALAAQLGGGLRTTPNEAGGTVHTLQIPCDFDVSGDVSCQASGGGAHR